MSQPFDFDAALKALQSGQKLTGKDDLSTDGDRGFQSVSGESGKAMTSAFVRICL